MADETDSSLGPSMSSVPIADHALLSDCHSAAMVTRAGSIDWLCFPRFDSPAVFARLLDDDAGHWLVTPDEVKDVTRSYLGSSLVLRTVFTTPHGRVQLTDGLVVGDGERRHDLGVASPICSFGMSRVWKEQRRSGSNTCRGRSTAWLRRCCAQTATEASCRTAAPTG